MLINWYASDGNKVTFPIGLSVSKVKKFGELPLKFQLQGDHMPVSPSAFGSDGTDGSRSLPMIPEVDQGESP
jgi:hypothetical protein